MSPQRHSAETDQILMMNCLMYGYVPMEFGLDTTPEPESPQPPTGFNYAWVPMAMALVLGLVGLGSVALTPRVTESLALHAKNTMTEMGVPARWNF